MSGKKTITREELEKIAVTIITEYNESCFLNDAVDLLQEVYNQGYDDGAFDGCLE